ncbi:hypothetical protein IM816_08630 [Luteibacter flocculans]|uniref:ANTAR domain-containing protein n=1 Tax=Luteibacter flocculans TaxID=2780091 RepID=A0ABY4T690_9GAMM|nr:hypothetical protein [Luteibacter flocculans]URL60126.1 hypothetical protein IM816_08630 [Luteibacter flocculans]
MTRPSAMPSTLACAPISPSMIAEEALALVEAFAARDTEEMTFRATMLLTYARDTGQMPLAVASIAFLEEVLDGGTVQHTSNAFEHVIAAAAAIVEATIAQTPAHV